MDGVMTFAAKPDNIKRPSVIRMVPLEVCCASAFAGDFIDLSLPNSNLKELPSFPFSANPGVILRSVFLDSPAKALPVKLEFGFVMLQCLTPFLVIFAVVFLCIFSISLPKFREILPAFCALFAVVALKAKLTTSDIGPLVNQLHKFSAMGAFHMTQVYKVIKGITRDIPTTNSAHP